MPRATVLLIVLALTACGGDGKGSRGTVPSSGPGVGSGGGSETSAMCSMSQLGEASILGVRRSPADAPLASLQHYAARRAARDSSAVLNSGGCQDNKRFLYAAGIGDITGASADSGMAGYADSDQVSTGLIDRQHARAFVFKSSCGGRTGLAVIVQMDIGLGFHSIRQSVIDAIAADAQLSSFYNDQNVMLNASHSHASAAGQSHHDAFHILTGGHDEQNLAAAVNGILKAIRRAHANLQSATPGPILFNQGELFNGTVNRSVPAYLNNPVAERQQFLDVNGNEVRTNRMMSLLRLSRDDGSDVGMLNWYPIHGTSIYQNNTLLSGDNKGYAAWRFEQEFETDYFSDETFAAGFLQADEGDNSPNLFVVDLSEPELFDIESTGFRNRAGGRSEPENALISGFKQYRRARDLYEAASEELNGEVLAASLFVDMNKVVVSNPRSYPSPYQPMAGEGFETCAQSLGVSFGAGAEDGRAFSAEGQTCLNTSQADVDLIAAFLADAFAAGSDGALPPQFIVPVGCDNAVYDNLGYACHAEKPILFPLQQPSPFHIPTADIPTQPLEPNTQKLQIIVLGNLAIVGLPWEVSTTSGRRLREAVLDVLQGAGIDYALISGLSNGYAHYLTTREEYASQQYEGASTIYGPWSQEAVEQELERMAVQLRQGLPVFSPFQNPSFRSAASTLRSSARANDGIATSAFGTVVQQPEPVYQLGEEAITVTARFVAGHPRNDLKSGDSYVFIERKSTAATWQVVQTDTDWFTRFAYEQHQPDGSNHAVISWIIPAGSSPGVYRIRHEGASAGGAYSGITESFELLACPKP